MNGCTIRQTGSQSSNQFALREKNIAKQVSIRDGLPLTVSNFRRKGQRVGSKMHQDAVTRPPFDGAEPRQARNAI